MTSLLIIVPARGGSKRLPGKNLRLLGGKSLLAHTAEAIRSAAQDAPVVLSTDDDAIAHEGILLGWTVPFRRPAELATDHATTLDTVLHTLDWYRAAHGADPASTMVLQPTSPFRGSACLREACRLLTERTDIDSVVAMSAIDVPPARLYLADADGAASPVADDARAPVYRPNGALYLSRTEAIRRDRKLYAGAILPLVLDGPRAIDIDTAADWSIAEAALASGLPDETASFHPKTARPVALT